MADPCVPSRPCAAHGTRARYVGCRCRCAPCRAANAAYEAGRSRRGDHVVPATAARDHLMALCAAGASLRDLAQRGPLSRATLERIRRGEVHTLRSRTAAAVLAMRPTAPVSVPASQVRAVLDAFARAGWSRTALTARTGVDVRVRGRSVSRRRYAVLCEAARRCGAELAPDGTVLADPLAADLLEWVEHWQDGHRAPA